MSSENGFPMSEEWKDVKLSYAARELACHSKSAYVKQLREKVCLGRRGECNLTISGSKSYASLCKGDGRIID